MCGMENLALSLCCTVLLGLIALACEKAYSGEYAMRTPLLCVLLLSGVTTVSYALFAANLGVASALGLFDMPIRKGIDFAGSFLPEKEEITAKACLTLTVIEVTALLFWWCYLYNKREKREKRSYRPGWGE